MIFLFFRIRFCTRVLTAWFCFLFLWLGQLGGDGMVMLGHDNLGDDITAFPFSSPEDRNAFCCLVGLVYHALRNELKRNE